MSNQPEFLDDHNNTETDPVGDLSQPEALKLLQRVGRLLYINAGVAVAAAIPLVLHTVGFINLDQKETLGLLAVEGFEILLFSSIFFSLATNPRFKSE